MTFVWLKSDIDSVLFELLFPDPQIYDPIDSSEDVPTYGAFFIDGNKPEVRDMILTTSWMNLLMKLTQNCDVMVIVANYDPPEQFKDEFVIASLFEVKENPKDEE